MALCDLESVCELPVEKTNKTWMYFNGIAALLYIVFDVNFRKWKIVKTINLHI